MCVAMGVAGQGQHESVARNWQEPQVVAAAARGTGFPQSARSNPDQRKKYAFLIVVKIVDSGAPVLAAEFEGVAATPGEVVQDLVALAGSAAGGC